MQRWRFSETCSGLDCSRTSLQTIHQSLLALALPKPSVSRRRPLRFCPSRPHYLARLCNESTLTIDTTAAGGNASLMALQEED